jgi:post-segregation antitoxin (ccd killing protein)
MRPALIFTFALLACSRPPALVQDARKLELARSLQHEMAVSVEFEKSAVLAFTDEESEAFASKSAAASSRVDKTLDELSPLVHPGERAALEAFAACGGEHQPQGRSSVVRGFGEGAERCPLALGGRGRCRVRSPAPSGNVSADSPGAG